MKPHNHKRNKKEHQSGRSTKRESPKSATPTDPNSQPETKDIFIDIEPDSSTSLLVKDQASSNVHQSDQQVQLELKNSLDVGQSITETLSNPPPDTNLEYNNQCLKSSDYSDSELPPLPDTLIKLSTSSGAEVYLVGTAHFSKKSAQDVEKVIRAVKPAAVVLELCQERAFMLDIDEESLLEQNRSLSFQKIREAIAEKGIAQGLIFVLFIKMSASITEKLGMAPGAEFRAGAREARKIAKCDIVLGDRSLKVTIARAVASISLWQKMKLVYQVIKNDVEITEEDVEKCKDKDILEQLLEELGGEYPGFKKVLVDERNVFLAHSIYKVAENSVTSQGPHKFIAVVGMGHVSGIVENWGKTTDYDVSQLNELPKTSKTKVVVTKTIKYCSLMLLIYVGYRAIIPSSIQEAISVKLSDWRS